MNKNNEALNCFMPLCIIVFACLVIVAFYFLFCIFFGSDAVLDVIWKVSEAVKKLI